MEKLIEYFAKQKTLVEVITIFVLAIGIFSMLKIRREVFPNINFDVINVMTTFPGASADAVEKLITNPLEQDLQEIDGIKKLLSVSVEGQSVITLQLDPDVTTSEDAERDIQDVVDAFTDLPEDAMDPVVMVIESKRTPIISFGISGNISENRLREISNDLETKIEKIRDVAKVQKTSYRDRELHIEADPQKMARYQVSLQDLIRTIQSNNINMPGGILETTDSRELEMIVRTVGEFETAEDVSNTVIRANALAQPIRVSDVAVVTETFEKRKKYILINGEQGIGVTVLKKERGDAIKLADQVKEVLKQEQDRYGDEVKLNYYSDSSYIVKRRLSVLTNNLGFGLLLVVIILSIILPFKVAMITAFGIPFAFLGAIAIFHLESISLNLLSMMGLIIVVGMLVDDAVVVTENAQRNIDKGMTPMEGAIAGTKEIWAPVTASVFTTMIAFAPMMNMSGIFGKFVMFIPLGVVIALAISLLECYFILPAHIGNWIKPRKPRKDGKPRKPPFFNRVWDNSVLPLYEWFLRICLKVRYLTVLLLIGFVAFSGYTAATKMDFILFPKGAIDTFFINFELPVGTPLDETKESAKPIIAALKELPESELQDFTTLIGTTASQNGIRARSGSHIGQFAVYLTAANTRERNSDDIIASLKERIQKPDNMLKLTFAQARGGPPVGKPVSVGVRGKEYSEIMKAVKEVKALVESVEGVLEVEDTYLKGKQELQVNVKPAEASAAQLSLRDIGTTIRAAFEGVVPTSIKKLDEEIDVRITLPADNRNEIDTLRNLKVLNTRGNLIPLERIADFEEKEGIAVYEHESNKRQVKVEGEINEELNNAKNVQAILKEKIVPIQEKYPHLSFHFSGEAEDTEESMQSLVTAMLFAVLGILLLLILLFKNLYQPLVVASTIPMGVVAVIWAFYFHGMPLSFLGIIGIIALAGVIVNNAIVLVDFVNKHKDESRTAIEAIVTASKIRFRPIFLTTMTTTAGILPTAYGWGGSDPFVVPIAMALGWGVFLGSIMTTLVFPAILGVVEDIAKLLRWIGSKLSFSHSI